MKIALGHQPRILITRADRIGDLILSTSVFPELRKKFPTAWIGCLTFLEHREILEGNPYLNEVILYDKKGREKGLWGNFLFARRLALKKFDIVIHLHATNRMHQLAWLAGIPVRLGWDRRSPWALTRVFPEIKKQGQKHEAEYNFELLDLLGIRCPEKLETFFPVSERASESLQMLLKHYQIPRRFPWVILAPGASCPSKIWPAERFGYLASAIDEKYPCIFLGIGSLQDQPLMEKIRAVIQAPFYDLSGKLSLGMLGALLRQSALMISNDSGPVHAASAVGLPVISIFGRNQPGLSPRRWRPLGEKSSFLWKDVGCHPCFAHDCQIHFLCLDVISVQDVMQEVEKFSEGLKPAVDEAYAAKT